MLTRSRIALLSACSAVAFSLAAFTPSYAADAPTSTPAASAQHTAKHATKHHAKTTNMHKKGAKHGTTAK